MLCPQNVQTSKLMRKGKWIVWVFFSYIAYLKFSHYTSETCTEHAQTYFTYPPRIHPSKVMLPLGMHLCMSVIECVCVCLPINTEQHAQQISL